MNHFEYRDGILFAEDVSVIDIAKAVDCQALAQQFGDSVKAAKADDAAKKSATELAGQGDKACNAHDYDAGIGQIRQALQQVGLKPTR